MDADLNTEITNAVNAANDRAQYEESANRLLGDKRIVAHILVDTVEEFKGMNPKFSCKQKGLTQLHMGRQAGYA